MKKKQLKLMMAVIMLTIKNQHQKEKRYINLKPVEVKGKIK